jgi:CheY-like chemotaxis protein
VEDEDGLRTLVTRILRRAGYTVLTAANGVEALQLCEAREVPPDLVLSDIVMPRMGGHRLAERLAAIHPKLKLLFMSGYADDEAARYGVLERGAPFLAKPFAADDLIRKVREVLDSSAKGS